MMTPTANKTKKTKHTRKEKGKSGVTIILKHYMIRHILLDKDEERIRFFFKDVGLVAGIPLSTTNTGP